MKIALFNEGRVGVVNGNDIVEISDLGHGSVLDVLVALETLRPQIERALASGDRMPLESVRLLAPIPRPGKILAMGSNYLEGTEGPPLPIWAFFKSPDSIIGPEETIVLPNVSARIFHHEAELVAIIGKKGKNISPEEAPSHVCGYTAGIDVSGRFEHLPTSILNKSHDGFAPIGPWVVTADDISDPHDLHVRLRVDGQPRQDFSTSDMGHRIWDSIAYLSAVTPLNPGDLIFTGTNHQGLGALQNGDKVELEIEEIGTLRVHVADPLNRTWPKGIDREIGQRVIEMIRTGTPPGSQRPAK
ncbi:fumarylacetoacetate hydrolase family protein [Sphingopyxis granuli]|uniref:fumarylacetoacetate hydrolase family protein n=1 Tax=Sphingopyxis granuli TaxID=267128 RepID=UPI001BAF8755|nr:fumarylacetoacetate hydrolase family protein [Sphingopyxis granuli]QUM71017.1 fumarylacetoacetate hydrolase family protein [Sphingopyxis granuli]